MLGNVGNYTGSLKLRKDDDFIEQLSHHYTAIILHVHYFIGLTRCSAMLATMQVV